MRCYIDQLPPFAVGFKSENEARKLIIDVTAWKAEHPDMWFEIFVELPEQPGIQYPVPATLNENELTWIISDEFTAVTGEGRYEVFGHSGETLKRTGAQTFTVLESVMEVSVTGVPDVSKPWVDQVLAAREVIANAQSMTAEFAEQAAQHAADAKEAAETVRGEIDNAVETMGTASDRAEDAADAANKAAQSASASAVNADTAARGAYEAQAQALEAIDQVRDTLEDLNMIGERVSDAGVDAANAAVQASAAAERANSVADVVMSTAGAAANDAAEAVKAAREATTELIKNANDEVGEAVRNANEAANNVQDGGYYTPTVMNDGRLFWSPSKDGMPFPASVNIKGPAGAPGETPKVTSNRNGDVTTVNVTTGSTTHFFQIKDGKPGAYIGSEAPDDPEIKLWINPDAIISAPDPGRPIANSALVTDHNGNALWQERTHYATPSELVIPEADVEFIIPDDGYPFLSAYIENEGIDVVPGSLVTVGFDGTQYSFRLNEHCEGGNLAIWYEDETLNTGEPFAFYAESGGFVVLEIPRGSEDVHRVSVRIEQEEVHTIDPKYLPFSVFILEADENKEIKNATTDDVARAHRQGALVYLRLPTSDPDRFEMLPCTFQSDSGWSHFSGYVFTDEAPKFVYYSIGNYYYDDRMHFEAVPRWPTCMELQSNTPNSQKRFRITVDDTGTLSATQVSE